MEEIALMALSPGFLDDFGDKSVISRKDSMGNPASNSCTKNNSLPGLSRTGSSRSTNWVSEGLGE